MAVILSAASCLDWVARLTGFANVAAALAAAEAAEPFMGGVTFLPYLAGERTPHNDPGARGAFTGLDLDTDGPALVRAVMEGVAFALADGLDVLVDAGAVMPSLSVIGGGARSPYWGRILAAALNRPLQYRQDGHIGPAFGAARLARLAVGGEDPDDLCRPPPIVSIQRPEPALVAAAAERRAAFRDLYPALRPSRAS
jgi:xylulokinase